MAGEGFMAHAINSLKQNRALLKKRNFKEIRDLYLKASGNTQVEFKKVSPQELFLIKQKIRKQHKRNVRIEIGIYIISVLLTTAFLFFLYWFISS